MEMTVSGHLIFWQSAWFKGASLIQATGSNTAPHRPHTSLTATRMIFLFSLKNPRPAAAPESQISFRLYKQRQVPQRAVLIIEANGLKRYI
jgi:hypothetical protein